MIEKDELLEIPRLAKEVREEEARIDSMREALTSPKGFDNRERVQSSGSQNSALVDVIIDLEHQLEEKADTLRLLERQAQKLFQAQGLRGEDNALMVMRYVEAYSWETIEQLMHYGRATIFRRHNRIMAEIYGEEQEKEEEQ